MPRYFFNVIDGLSPPDAEGVIFDDFESAKAAAVVLSGEMLRDLGAKFWKCASWKLEIADDRGLILLILRFTSETPAPAPVSC